MTCNQLFSTHTDCRYLLPKTKARYGKDVTNAINFYHIWEGNSKKFHCQEIYLRVLKDSFSVGILKDLPDLAYLVEGSNIFQNWHIWLMARITSSHCHLDGMQAM